MFKLVVIITVALILVLVTAGCTSITRESITVEQAAVADITTTAIVLEHGAHELNPLGFLGSTLVKGYYIFSLRPQLDRQTGQELDRISRSIWSGAAVNNAMQMVVPGLFSVWLGTLTFFLLYD